MAWDDDAVSTVTEWPWRKAQKHAKSIEILSGIACWPKRSAKAATALVPSSFAVSRKGTSIEPQAREKGSQLMIEVPPVRYIDGHGVVAGSMQRHVDEGPVRICRDSPGLLPSTQFLPLRGCPCAVHMGPASCNTSSAKESERAFSRRGWGPPSSVARGALGRGCHQGRASASRPP